MQRAIPVQVAALALCDQVVVRIPGIVAIRVVAHIGDIRANVRHGQHHPGTGDRMRPAVLRVAGLAAVSGAPEADIPADLIPQPLSSTMICLSPFDSVTEIRTFLASASQELAINSDNTAGTLLYRFKPR